ncbi:hypothetical protein AB1K09_20275 [Solibacillus silvestris]
MNGKFLGRITNAEFGVNRDYPFLFGLELEFKMDIGCVATNISVNISDNCNWSETDGRDKALGKQALKIVSILEDAKVSYVSQLVGKPVEVELDHNLFKSFRILTEVL